VLSVAPPAPAQTVIVVPAAAPPAARQTVVVVLLAPAVAVALGVDFAPEPPHPEAMTTTMAMAHAAPNRAPTAHRVSVTRTGGPT
jgi:hypothetical protein